MEETTTTPTIREAQEASDLIGWDRVDAITHGRGLSGASARQLRRIVDLAAAENAS